ncbi:MAG: hypothetical protein HXY22_12840 [Alphaproteobacteria bacterium]|nr:hypothetical protein [Alphaproteobacteria bacterium]
MADREHFHIVILRDGLRLVRHDGHWRRLQERYRDYMASLGPFTADEALEMIRSEWPDVAAVCAKAVQDFAASLADELSLEPRESGPV